MYIILRTNNRIPQIGKKSKKNIQKKDAKRLFNLQVAQSSL